jgi:hypothetical protein
MAGNAVVTLYGAKGNQQFELWLQVINTSTSNEFANQQVRDSMEWIPIRRSEMFVQFTALWPLVTAANNKLTLTLGYENIDPTDGFSKMQAFQEAIRYHQQSAVNGATLQPMLLNYFNNSDPSVPIYNPILNQNIVQPHDKAIKPAKTKPLVWDTTTSSMQFEGWISQAEKQYFRFQNVFTTTYSMNILTHNTANTPLTTGTLALSYPPTTKDQSQLGTGWLNIGNLASNTKSIKGLPG